MVCKTFKTDTESLSIKCLREYTLDLSKNLKVILLKRIQEFLELHW